MNRLLVVLIFALLGQTNSIIFAQRTQSVVLDWQTSEFIEDDNSYIYDYIKDHKLNVFGLAEYTKVVPSRSQIGYIEKAVLNSYNSIPASSREVKIITDYGIELKEFPELDSKTSNSRGQKYLVLALFPFYKEGNTIRKVSDFTYSVSQLSDPSPMNQSRATVYPPNSVLRDGTGDWYKIAVQNSGIFKIDKNLLEEMGIDVSSINPQHINIFGNATPMLPISNSVNRPNDLEKNSIFVFGESDGVFNDNDYILFYGQGSTTWEYSVGYGFRHQKNLYDDYTYYYLNINPSETALRITDEAEIVAASDFSVTEYNDYDFYEEDLENQTKGGKNWYGEKFDYILSYDFLFSFADLILTDSIKINMVYCASEGSLGSTMETRINGSLVDQSSVIIGGNSSYRRNFTEFYYVPSSSTLNMNLTLDRTNPVLKTWLDYIELNVKKNLVYTPGATQVSFRNADIVGNGLTLGEYTVTNAFNAQVWNITDPKHPTNVFVNQVGNNAVFKSYNDSLKEFVCFRGVPGQKPIFIEQVEHQDLHALSQADYIIIYHPLFEEQAIRLGELHVNTGKSVHVVNVEHLYEEFSCGIPDPTSIKSFLKMFYDRAGGDPNLVPDNVLLFGDGSYDPKDRIVNNTNFIPAYEKTTSPNSESTISNMAIEDYFVILDDNESDAPADLVDMGIGRLVVRNVEEATICVDKIQHYLENGSNLFNSDNVTCSADGGTSTYGEWRNYITLMADNQHSDHFVKQQEIDVYNPLSANYPDFNFDKLYIDAFPLEVTTGGYRSPDLVQRLNERVKKGTLIASYCGHGGELGLASERIVTIPQIEAWDNINKLMLFVSATCEFTRFDDPSRYSAGEVMSLSSSGGAITLFTTTRPVTFSNNDLLNRNLMSLVLTRDANGAPLTFGEIMSQTKVLSAGGSDNYRAFATIGDPALRLAIPEFKVVADSINGVLISSGNADTLKALKEITISGHVENTMGVKQTFYNGVVFPTILDKTKTISTLGQTTEDSQYAFDVQNNILYKGAATVTNGDFSMTFIVPKDINYNFGYGKISFYADNDSIDNQGYDTTIVVGGIDTSAVDDNDGPQIELYLNDENFVNGGVTDESPVLVASIFDVSGINTVGNGIGHDITVVLDEDTQNPIVVNDFYTSDLDTYQSGKVNYPISNLEEGNHSVTFKVWDVHNNSSDARIDFVVANAESLTLNHVLNYPNPFSTHTEFYFEHNQHCQFLETQIQIFSVSGKLVKTINQMVRTEGYRTEGIPWDGRDDFGDVIGKGVYIYRVSVVSPDGEKVEKFEKLVILN